MMDKVRKGRYFMKLLWPEDWKERVESSPSPPTPKEVKWTVLYCLPQRYPVHYLVGINPPVLDSRTTYGSGHGSGSLIWSWGRKRLYNSKYGPARICNPLGSVRTISSEILRLVRDTELLFSRGLITSVTVKSTVFHQIPSTSWTYECICFLPGKPVCTRTARRSY